MDDIRASLARATAPLHRRVDRAASRFDLSTEAGALGFLGFLAGGFRPVERALDRAGAERLLPEWPERRRAGTLPPGDEGPEPALRNAAEVWGALYVLEGSRLGGRLLARAPGLAGHPFFADAGDRAFWPRFLGRLADADRVLGDRAGVAAGAVAAYGAFLGPSPTTADCDGAPSFQGRLPTVQPYRDTSGRALARHRNGSH